MGGDSIAPDAPPGRPGLGSTREYFPAPLKGKYDAVPRGLRFHWHGKCLI